MAGLLGSVLPGAVYPETTTRISPGLNQNTPAEYDPTAHPVAGQNIFGGYSAFRMPTRNGWAIKGNVQPSFLQDYYFRIHITPGVLAVGNVVTEQVHEVFVWNSYLGSRTLNSIDEQATEGLTIAGQPNPPLEFTPLQERLWEISVFTDGPPVINAVITWQFTGEKPVALSVSGNRIAAWPFTPSWEDGVHERLEWLTDVLPSRNNTEQCRALRDLPRRFYTFDVAVDGMDRAMLDLALFGWGGRVWALPIWHDVQWLQDIAMGAQEILCETEHRDFAEGGLVLLRGQTAADYEVLEVLSIAADRIHLHRPVQQDWPGQVRLYPMRTARLIEQPRMPHRSDDITRTEVKFRLEDPANWPAAADLPLYRSKPVLELRPAESDDLSNSFVRLLQQLDNRTGVPDVRDTAGLGFQVQNHRWLLEGPKQRADFRSLCYHLSGRQGRIWIPTFMQDLQLVATVPSSAISIDVRAVGYGRFAGGQLGRRDIRIELKDGRVWYARVTGASDVDSSTERLGLESALPESFSPAEVRAISWMALSRPERDDVELQHITDIEGAATSQVMFRGVRDDV